MPARCSASFIHIAFSDISNSTTLSDKCGLQSYWQTFHSINNSGESGVIYVATKLRLFPDENC